MTELHPIRAHDQSGEEAANPELVRTLEEMRGLWAAATLEADEAERVARSKRRHAKNLHDRYEKLLLEHSGQLQLPYVDRAEG